MTDFGVAVPSTAEIEEALGWILDPEQSSTGNWIFLSASEPNDPQDPDNDLFYVGCIEVIQEPDGTYSITPSVLALDSAGDQIERPDPAGVPVFNVEASALIETVKRVQEEME